MANVLFNRVEDSTQLDNIPVVDGSLYVTGDGKTFIDYGEERLPVGGTPDTEMSDRSRNTVENNVIKQYVDNSIISRKLLWTNPNPSASSFSTQTITLSSDDYDCYEIIYQFSQMNVVLSNTGKIPKGNNVNIFSVFNNSTNTHLHSNRLIRYENDTTLYAENCYSSTENDTTNSRCIPLYVIGYKTGLFE